MPLYEYEELDTGRLVELSRPMKLRDDCPPNLKRVMSRTSRPRVGRGPIDPATADAAVPRALKQLEETMPADQIARQSGFSTKEMKRIWNIK